MERNPKSFAGCVLLDQTSEDRPVSSVSNKLAMEDTDEP